MATMDAQRWQRISPLLDALLDMPATERSAHLAILRQEDAALADELERLLTLDASTPDFLATPVLQLPSGVLPGMRLGPYRLERLLGEGGMGQVWLATRADGLYERKVALKLLRPGLANPQLRQRFDRERDILARLSHPFIAQLLDAGIDANGQPYLALEYVEGEPIIRWCQLHQLDIPARLDLFRQVCDAVSHAHANLVVHRDLKPSNILVTASGQVRLLDFGIAKLLDSQPPSAEQTRPGMRTFTLHYAAPEQIRGEPVTTMTDVYSLGVVLYELLTGHTPYRLTRQTDAEWEEAILTGEPIRPSHAAARATPDTTRPYTPAQLARKLSGDLDNILLRALAKRPEQRYASAEALAQDLLCHLRGQPVSARGEQVAYRLRKYLQRHRWGIATTASILLVLLTALVVVGWQAQHALREARRAEALQRFLADLLQDAAIAADTPIELRNLLDLAILRSERSLANEPLARAELYGIAARLRLDMGDDAEAADLLQRQARLLATQSAAPEKLQLEAATLHGQVHQQLGAASACVTTLQPLQPLARQMTSQLPLTVAAYDSQLGRCLHALGHTDQAKRLFAQALALRRHQSDAAGIAESTQDQATLLADGGHTDAALMTVRRGLEQLERTTGARPPHAIGLLQLACILEARRDAVAQAQRDCRAALDLAQTLHGRHHRRTIEARRTLATLELAQGHLTAAQADLQDSADWLRRHLPPDHPDLANVHADLARVAWELGETAHAMALLQLAMDTWRRTGDARHLADGLSDQAQMLHGSGRDPEALPVVRQALAIRQRLPELAGDRLDDDLRLLGEIQTSLGQSAAARTNLTVATRIARANVGPQHPRTRRAEIALARLDAILGAPDARQRLLALTRPAQDTLAQRAMAWRARAALAALDCRQQPQQARAQMTALLREIHTALPEGGALPREIMSMQTRCDAPAT